jgi:Leucine-rich repeat (LRR) protein
VWDEDDTEAVLALQKSCMAYGKVLSCKFKNRSDICLMALNTSHKYTMLFLASESMTVDRLDLLEGFLNITNLTLENIIPGDWTLLKRLSCLENFAVEQTQESEASCYDLMFDVLASMPKFECLALKNTPDMSHKIGLPSLKQLELYNTQFDFGQLPSKISSLNATRVSCKPYELPPSLFRPLLTNLSIQHSVHMSGSIPSEVGLARQLCYLNLSGNNLEGSIPTEVGSLGLLKLLDLSFNKLGGAIPSELGKASSLLNVNLSHNKLTNSIPCQLGELAYLVYLDLSYNKLTGQVPPELGELQLRSFRTVQNRLCPSLPSTLIHNKVYYGDSF